MHVEVLPVIAFLPLVPLLAAEMHGKRHINLPTHRAGAPYSDVVVVGDTVYLSGRIGIDPTTRKLPESVEQEARLILDGMKQSLAAAGLTMDDLVQVQIFCPDVSLFERFNAIYVTYFQGELPARAFLGSGPLLFGAHFEVMGIAHKAGR